MVRNFNILSQTSTSIQLTANELRSNTIAYVVYDNYQSVYTSTGLVSASGYPDYISWQCYTSTDSNNVVSITISNSNIYPSVSPKVIDYTTLNFLYIVVVCTVEFNVLRYIIPMVDKVRMAYPFRFQKKHTLEQLLIFIEAALIDVNMYNPITSFWWGFESSNYAPGTLPYVRGMQAIHPTDGSVPIIWTNILGVGAILQSLTSQGILEIDINYQHSDQGIALSYNNISGIQSQWTMITAQFEQSRKILKQNYRTYGRGIGTAPIAGMGWTQVINNLYGNRVNDTMYPWWGSGGSGQAQM